MRGIEPLTFSLPRKRSTPELHRLLVGLRRLFSSGRRGSNSRPTAWKAVALPTELLPQFGKNLHVLVGVSGLEPLNPKERIYSPPQLPLCDTPFFCFVQDSYQVSCTCAFTLSHQSGSNQRPTDYKSVALPAELWWLVCFRTFPFIQSS